MNLEVPLDSCFQMFIIIKACRLTCAVSILQHPVTWQPSKEGDHLIGRITLSKRSATMPKEAGALLGLKVRDCLCNMRLGFRA